MTLTLAYWILAFCVVVGIELIFKPIEKFFTK